MVPVPLRRVTALLISIVSLIVASPLASGQGVLIPVKNWRHFVFDHAGRYLYLTMSDGWVRRHNLSTGELEDVGYLGGRLNGFDIAADDSFLLVAQGASSGTQGIVHRIDLQTGALTNITYELPSENGGTSDVAIASNGIALVTAFGSSFVNLRQIDLTTNTVTVRNDAPGGAYSGNLIRAGAIICRSDDGTRLVISETTSLGDGDCFSYSAQTNTFGPRGLAGSARTAVSRNGSLMATGIINSLSVDGLPDYNFRHVFGHLGGGVTFDAVTDTLYSYSLFSNEIIAYDTNTFVEKFRLTVGEGLAFDQDLNGFTASHDGLHLALSTASGIRLFKIPTTVTGPPAPEIDVPIDMVFDHSGQYLYISTLLGFIWPYNLVTGQFESPYNLGGWLHGIDIAPDDSFLLVAQYYRGANQGVLHKLDLNSGQVTHITYPLVNTEMGAWDVAIASNGRALFTARLRAYGWLPLREVDLATNTVSVRTDAPASDPFNAYVTAGTNLYRSADRTRVALLEGNISNGPLFTYDAVANSFGPKINLNSFLDHFHAAVNRNGTLLGLHSTLRSLPNLASVHTFSGWDSGVAFDAVRDRVYRVNADTNQIIACDSGNFSEQFRLDIGEAIGGIAEPFDVGNLVASPDGNYLALTTPTTVRVFNVGSGSVTALPTPPPPAPKGQLANISTRAFVNDGDNVTIAGFILLGRYPEKIFLRAIGPSLAAAGVPGAMQDPALELYNSTGALIATNDNWKDSPQQAQMVSAGLAPKDMREAGIVATLEPGAYTAVLRGKNQSTGNAIVELYDGGPQFMGTRQLLGNISTRGLVGVNDSVMIAGFITTGGATRVLVRGIGPSLAAFNVPNPVPDPVVELYNSNGTIITSNDNWQDINATEIWNTGVAPSSNLESAMSSTVPAGSYTAILRGKDNSTGNGLIEVYSL